MHGWSICPALKVTADCYRVVTITMVITSLSIVVPNSIELP